MFKNLGSLGFNKFAFLFVSDIESLVIIFILNNSLDRPILYDGANKIYPPDQVFSSSYFTITISAEI